MADRMSPKSQVAARSQREREIASMAPAQRDSALAAFNREKAVAQARARLASSESAPKKSSGFAPLDKLLKALQGKKN